MNILSKLWSYIRFTNKIHPFSKVKIHNSDFSIEKTTMKFGSELEVINGKLKISKVWLDKFVSIKTSGVISIGVNTTVNFGAKIYGDVIIGKECLIAPNVFISSSSHLFDYKKGYSIRTQEKLYLESHSSLPSFPIVIGDDVWISVNCVILPGINICSHVVIGANSVVTKSITISGVYVGSPARKIRDL